MKRLLHPARATLLGIGLLFGLCVLGFAEPSFAQQAAFSELGNASTLPTENIAIIIARIIRVAISVVGIILVGMVIYAGFLYLFARGEMDPVKKAKKIFQQSIIGLLIIFSAFSITTFILNRLLNSAFTGSTKAVADQYAEALSGSLGGGILEDHYPERNAQDIPRNTRIFVSFKEAINPESLMTDVDTTTRSGNVNTGAVLVYPTAEGVGSALESADVVVTYDETAKLFVFDPVEYLGTASQNVNYTVALTSEIEQASGQAAFTGVYASGYQWTFEVSTEVDLTPPYVVSVIPTQDAQEPRNVTIEMTFNEAVDPVAVTGSYLSSEGVFFNNISAQTASGSIIEGTWEISNAYRTVSFTTTDACGEDPCGETIYCLPENQQIRVLAKSATLKEEEVPQAEPVGVSFDGVVDAASNSLDGDGDGLTCGSEFDTIVCENGSSTDHYEWTFETTDEMNNTVPQILSLDPGIEEGEVSQTQPVEAVFNVLLKASTLNSTAVSLWPDPYYESWFAVRKQDDTTQEQTTVQIQHPTLVSTEDGGWDYWPVMTSDIKSSYQICMYPAIGPGSTCTAEDRMSGRPYCCNGVAQESACSTDAQSGTNTLPDNTETQL